MNVPCRAVFCTNSCGEEHIQKGSCEFQLSHALLVAIMNGVGCTCTHSRQRHCNVELLTRLLAGQGQICIQSLSPVKGGWQSCKDHSPEGKHNIIHPYNLAFCACHQQVKTAAEDCGSHTAFGPSGHSEVRCTILAVPSWNNKQVLCRHQPLLPQHKLTRQQGL